MNNTIMKRISPVPIISFLMFGMLTGFILLVLVNPAGATGPAESMIPSTITVDSGSVSAGETFIAAIDLQVPPPDNLLSAVTIDIEYDPTFLNYEDGSCQTNQADFQLNLCNQSDGDGQPPDVISYSALSILGVNGDLNLGAIPFIGVGPGMSELTIVVRTFEDRSGESPIIVNGTIEVQDPTAISLKSISAEITPQLSLENTIIGVLVIIVSLITVRQVRKKKFFVRDQ